jgi:hypothetical protein
MRARSAAELHKEAAPPITSDTPPLSLQPPSPPQAPDQLAVLRPFSQHLITNISGSLIWETPESSAQRLKFRPTTVQTAHRERHEWRRSPQRASGLKSNHVDIKPEKLWVPDRIRW